MNIKAIKSFELKDYNSICIFTNENGLAEIKTTYSELKSFLNVEKIKFNNESILTLPLIKDNKKITINLLGFNEDATPKDIMDAFGQVAKKLSSAKMENILCDISTIASKFNEENMLAAIKGLVSGSYSFNKFITNKKSVKPNIIDIYSDNSTADTFISKSLEIANATLLARTLVDEPSNSMTPNILANKVKEVFEDTVIDVSIFDEHKIEKLGMNLYLAVGKGSAEKPRLIVMRYNGNPTSDEKIGLIGKGVTYDTGGYSIKPTGSMITMKSDMGGGAAVIGAMKIIAMQQPNVNVVGIIAACENRISETAYLPGDIWTSMNGKTVEIVNTDAEGRLTLADAMTYAIRIEKATKVVDICTLTGACVVALGEEYTGVVTWDDELWNKVDITANKTLESCWRLPLNKTFQKKNHSKVADLKNAGDRWGGAITAGAFVGEFAENKPWVHLDIAGTAYIESEKPALRPGGTGFGAHLLAELVKIL